MAQTSKEEVKIALQRPDDPNKVADGTADLARDNASDLGRRRVRKLPTWSIPKEQRPLRRLQRLWLESRRIPSNAPSYRREGSQKVRIEA
jgi:hypothetical protein